MRRDTQIIMAVMGIILFSLQGFGNNSFALPFQIDFTGEEGYNEGSILGQPSNSEWQWRNGNSSTPPDAIVINEALFMASDGNGGKSRHRGRWAVFTFPRQTSGILSVTWDWRYLGSEQWGIDAGFSVSDSSNFTDGDKIKTQWDLLGAMAHMKHGQPFLEACDGDGAGGREYVALHKINFADGGLLRMRMEIDIQAQTYDLYATPEGERETVIARNSGFRRSINKGLDSIVLWENGQLAGAGMLIGRIVLAKGTKAVDKPVRCAVYARALPDELPAIDTQRKAVLSYINERKEKNWILLPNQYNDPGFSGLDSDRPAYTMLLDAVRNRKIDCLAVYHLDRLTSSYGNFCQLLQMLKDNYVRLVSVSQEFDTETDNGQKMLEFLFSFHSKQGGGSAGKAAMVNTGDWWTLDVAIPGFDTETEDTDAQLMLKRIQLIPKPDDADSIEYIFDTFLTCKSLIRTAYFLNEIGLTTAGWESRGYVKTGGYPYTAKRVEAILRNPSYLGLTKNFQEPLVDRETFDEAAALLKQ